MAARPKVLILGSPVPGHRPEREILEPLAEIVTARVDAGAELAAAVRDVDAAIIGLQPFDAPLIAGMLAAAGLDVFETEPLPTDSPLVGLDNVIRREFFDIEESHHTLHEAGLSPHAGEVLRIRVDIDTNPPAGATTETRLIRRFGMLNLLHYDRASLFAGKLHALLARGYTKGRDLYDLAWYLSDPEWPAPNLTLLNSALRQAGWTGRWATPDTWRELIADKLRSVDWQAAQQDVTPFLERAEEVRLVTGEVLLPLLRLRPAG